MRVTLLSGLLVGAALALGCGDDDDDDVPGTGGTAGEAGMAGAAGDGGAGTGGVGGAGGGGAAGEGGMAGAGGAPGQSALRVAHLSPDAPPVDVCVNPGDGFMGPVLATAGDEDGLAYAELTGYVPVPPGTYTVRIVAPGAENCDTALADLEDIPDVTLEDGLSYTAAAVGMVTPAGEDEAFGLRLFEDLRDPESVTSTYIRVIHASPDAPAVDVGTGTGTEFTPIFENVAFGEEGRAEGDQVWYTANVGLVNITITVRPTGTEDEVLSVTGLNFTPATLTTVFAIGNADGDPQPLELLVCAHVGGVTTCTRQAP